jgi:threonine dehydrogenase-like Zn-dependent dehydrogenase
MERAAQLLTAMPEVAKAMITHRFPLNQAPAAFATASDRSSGAIKVVLEP